MSKKSLFRKPVPKPDSCEALKQAALRGEVRIEAFCHGNYPGRPLPAGKDELLRLVGHWDAPVDQNWGLDWHCNEGVEIGFLEAGRLAFEVDHYASELQSGTITITRPWQRHKVGNPNVPASRYHWIILDVGIRHPHQTWKWPDWLLLPKEELANLTKLLSHNEQPVWRANEPVIKGFQALGKAVSLEVNPRNVARVKLWINEILMALLDLLQENQPHLDQRLSSSERAVRLFLQNLPRHIDEAWTLERMAGECGMGRSHFSHYCKQITNYTPLEYLTRCRMDVAAEILVKYLSKSITEIAFECGFQSSQYFATVFTRQKGVSPRAFRNHRRGFE